MSKQDVWIICLNSVSFISELNFFCIEVCDLAHGMEARGGGREPRYPLQNGQAVEILTCGRSLFILVIWGFIAGLC